MDPNSSSSKLNPKIQSFLEALRNNQGQISGSERPNPLLDLGKKKEQDTQRIQEFYQTRSQEWHKVFHAKDRQEAARIDELKNQIKQVISKIQVNTVNIARNLESPVPETGSYHISFLEHLLDLAQLMFVQSNDTNNWLSVYQSRSKKQGHYWSQAKSKGTSFTLHQDRSPATSVG